ncbi:MAG: lysophospholipid acyltransferase family protein [Flammeovirgaceae bacterium]
MNWLYFFSDIIAFVVSQVIRYRRKVIYNNLKIAFPDKSEKELKEIMQKFYQNFADIVVESLKSISITEEEMRKRVSAKGVEIMENYYAQKKSIIALASHQANWEWLLLGGCLQLSSPIDAVYKPLANKLFDDLMLKIRSKFGGRPIAMKQIFREIIRRKGEIRTFALVSDQSPASWEAKIWKPFFGKETPFFVGPQKIAQATQYPVVFAGIRRLKRGYYEIEFSPLAEPPYSSDGWEVIEKFSQKTEQYIRENPSEWLWSHKRWKHKKE